MSSPIEPGRADESQAESSGIVDLLTPWLLVAFATLAAIGAIARVVGESGTRLLDRLNETTLLYLAVGAALLLLRRIKALSFGGYKLEMLEQIRERQVRQEDLLRHIMMRLLPLLLPEPERRHLVNLDRGATKNYQGGGVLQGELRHMRSVGLIRMRKDKDNQNKAIGSLRQGETFDLADFVELSPLGEQWVKTIRDVEMEGGAPAGKPADQGSA
jgi:hypothetical protein